MTNLDKEKSLSTGELKDLKNTFKCEGEVSCKQTLQSDYIQSITKNKLPVYKLFKQKEYNVLKEQLKDMDVFFKGVTFYSHFEFKEYLIRHEGINMVDVLDIPKKEDDLPFDNILNPFNDTSLAETFRSIETGIELYKVSQGNIIGNMITVVSLLIEEDLQETCKILAEVFNVKIHTPKEIIEFRESSDTMVQNLRSGSLRYKMPNFYKVYGSYIEIVAFLIEFISKQEYYFDKQTGKYKVLSYMSLRGYVKEYRNNYSGFNKEVKTMSNNINALTLGGVLIKLETKDIPNEINKIIIAYQRAKEFRNRTDVITLPIFNDEYLEQLECKSTTMLAMNLNKSYLNKDTLTLIYGVEETSKVHVQLKENEKKVSKKTSAVLDKVTKIVMNQISKYGYVSEIKVLDRLFRNLRKTEKTIIKSDVKKEYDKVKQVVCLNNNLKRTSLTKGLRVELNIRDSEFKVNTRPTIFIPL